MRVTIKHRDCACRTAGECSHNLFAEDHALDNLTHKFRGALSAKIALKKSRGKRGWSDPGWTIEDMKRQLIAHVEKGDPIDVAAFAMFWWNRTDEDAARKLGGT